MNNEHTILDARATIKSAFVAYGKLIVAEAMWTAELKAAFAGRANDIRDRAEGRGEPDSALRMAHDAYVAARDAYHGSEESAIVGALRNHA